MFAPTTALQKILKLKKKIKGIQGGTSASKTISILMLEIDHAQRATKPGLTSVVSESLPHLKRGALRDFKMIMQQHNYWKDDLWRESDKVYTFETGWQIEFFSADQPDKLRGGRRDRLFINEANNIPLDAFDQLEVRTKDSVFLDWNPSHEFWFYTDVLGQRNDVDHLTITYKDNEALSDEIVKAIEARKNNKAWWQVYGLGQLGEIETRIYKGWTVIDEVPPEARLVRRGLDFGYSNDPTAIVDVYECNGGYVLDEQLYRKGMLNKQIADFINGLPESSTLVIADSAEPKSIEEIKQYGVAILPTEKGQDSINQGIQLVQSVPILVTKNSVNLLKEYRNYLWKTDRDGKHLNVPEDMYNHCMDALRYAIRSLRPHQAPNLLAQMRVLNNPGKRRSLI